MAEQIRFWLTPVPEAEADPFLGPQMAYDLAVLQPEATVGDYLTGLAEFQAATLADCKGCDGCCHERAPLTIADWQLSGHSGEPAGGLAEWLLDWAELSFCGPAVDLTWKKSKNAAPSTPGAASPAVLTAAYPKRSGRKPCERFSSTPARMNWCASC